MFDFRHEDDGSVTIIRDGVPYQGGFESVGEALEYLEMGNQSDWECDDYAA